MSSVELKSNATTNDDGRVVSCPPGERDSIKSHNRIVPILITFGTVALATLLVWAMWGAYMSAAWTRDGQVRACRDDGVRSGRANCRNAGRRQSVRA